jgi:hypothetical protein
MVIWYMSVNIGRTNDDMGGGGKEEARGEEPSF